MTADRPLPDLPQVRRRQLMQAAVAAVVATAAACVVAGPVAGQGTAIAAEEHWAKKGAVELYLYRKRLPGEAGAAKPVLFLVHGSTFSSRGSYDLQVPGHPGYSMMDHFAARGFDVWTMDHEGYGRSSRTESHAGIMVGVEDLKAALPVVERATGQRSVMMYGASSGAIRAAAFAAAEPARVERLILNAYTHTGENAPEIDRRRAQAERYKANPRRPLTRAGIQRIFERDMPGVSAQPVIDALAAYELAFGDTVPSGTYLDMAVNLPMVDPAHIKCPACMVRAEVDGNASEEELMRFYAGLPNKDKQFIMIAGQAHAGGHGLNRHRLWHAVQAFLTYPPMRSA
ncbi:MAG TPA: alpha/beta hydrolase [Hyphomicrobiaceae bacterium]|nr:alpha/beta hydrolase [Hyphomicrobiaceae bacterium]